MTLKMQPTANNPPLKRMARDKSASTKAVDDDFFVLFEGEPASQFLTESRRSVRRDRKWPDSPRKRLIGAPSIDQFSKINKWTWSQAASPMISSFLEDRRREQEDSRNFYIYDRALDIERKPSNDFARFDDISLSIRGQEEIISSTQISPPQISAGAFGVITGSLFGGLWVSSALSGIDFVHPAVALLGVLAGATFSAMHFSK